MQVWGKTYCDALTELCLPALLSPGNIPALVAEWPARFILYTREQDIPQITAAESYQRLAAILPVEFKTIDEQLKGSKYLALTRIHQRVLGAAAYGHAAIVWLVPDAIWGDGSLRTVSRAAAAGKRAVMQPAIRVLKDEALAAVSRRVGEPGFTGFESRELVSLALDHMHPYYRSCYVDAPKFNRNPALVFWPVGTEGLLARGFHLHPLMLFPSRTVANFTSTFDDDLPLLACPDYRDFHVVEDSDEAFHIDLTEADWCRLIPLRRRRGSAFFIARWALRAANLHHRRFIRHRIRIHAVDCSPAWQPVERRSDRLVARARAWIALHGIARLPFELLFGQRRGPFRAGLQVVPGQTHGRSRPARALDWCRRKAYLFACGWVFGHMVACGRMGWDPRGWVEKLVAVYFTHVYLPYWDYRRAVETQVAHARLALINQRSRWRKWYARRKKRTRGFLRRSYWRLTKTVDRRVRLARDRIQSARRVLRRIGRMRLGRGRLGRPRMLARVRTFLKRFDRVQERISKRTRKAGRRMVKRIRAAAARLISIGGARQA